MPDLSFLDSVSADLADGPLEMRQLALKLPRLLKEVRPFLLLLAALWFFERVERKELQPSYASFSAVLGLPA